MRYKKKIILIFFVTIFLFIVGFSVNFINNKIELKMTESIIANSGFSTQLGVIQSMITNCIPSCQTAPDFIAKCCAPTGMCPFVVPGLDGSYETACPMYSDVNGIPAGGLGYMALLSNTAIAKAGLTSGGQFIYGGTTNNMSLGGKVNTVLASSGGCYGCMGGLSFTEKVKEKFKFFIAGFKK